MVIGLDGIIIGLDGSHIFSQLWLLLVEEILTVKKVAVVNAALRDTDPSDARVVLDESVAIEKVRALVEVYIP